MLLLTWSQAYAALQTNLEVPIVQMEDMSAVAHPVKCSVQPGEAFCRAYMFP